MSVLRLRSRLRALGLTDEVVRLAWPEWWVDEAELSASANAELRFSLSRNLGLDAEILADEDEPKFYWTEASFKGLSARTNAEQEAICSFGTAIARLAVNSIRAAPKHESRTAQELRSALLRGAQSISLRDLLICCWALGIPTIYVGVFPLRAKRFCAMAVRAGGRYAILLAKKTRYHAQAAYYVAHELGHIMLGHLDENAAIVDFDDPLTSKHGQDDEETAADAYALELLTGEGELQLTGEGAWPTASVVANAVARPAAANGIDAGTLALCFGHATGHWRGAFGALKILEGDSVDAVAFINRFARGEFAEGALPLHIEQYLERVMGMS